ncbi:hypothetical protein CANFE03_05650 [Ligilactobacillus animalis]
MKWTKNAGLVSCDFEAQLISKINNDLECEKAKKKADASKKRGEKLEINKKAKEIIYK